MLWEGVREGQSALLDQEAIALRHSWVLQHKNRQPAGFERLACPGPGTAFLGVAGHYQRTICQGVDQFMLSRSFVPA